MSEDRTKLDEWKNSVHSALGTRVKHEVEVIEQDALKIEKEIVQESKKIESDVESVSRKVVKELKANPYIVSIFSAIVNILVNRH